MNKNKSLTVNSVFYMLYNVLNLIFPFLTSIYVVRILPSTDIGAVEYARNIAQYFVILAFLGIPTYGMREVAKIKEDKSKLNKLFSELFLINLCSTVLFLMIYLVMIFSIARFNMNIILYLISGVTIAANALDISWLYNGLEEYKYTSIRNMIFKIASFALLIIFVKGETDYLKYAAITVFGTVGNNLLNIFHARKFVRFDVDDLEIRRHIKPIFTLVVVNLAIEIYSLVDTTMLGIFCDSRNVAYYTYAHKIQKILLQVVNTFTIVMVPRITHYYNTNQNEKFNALLSKTLNIIILISVPMFIGIQFVADFFVTIIYTNEYIISSSLLKMQSVLLIITPIGYLLGSRVLLVTGHENKMVFPVVCGAIINLFGNFLLIPRYAELGAVIASILSETIIMIVYVNQGRRYFRLKKIVRNIVKILLSAIIMSIALYLISKINIADIKKCFFEILVGVFCYFVSLLILKEDNVSFYFKVIINKLRTKLEQ